MPTTRMPVCAPAALHDFLAAHGRPGLGADAPFLLSLARGPDSMFDLHDAAGRALVAVLTDACDNSGGAAELVILASRDRCPSADILATCLDIALAEARRGPRAFLETVVDDLLVPHLDLLEARELVPRFELVSMEKRRPHVPVAAAPGWTWSDFAEPDGQALRALGRAAFRGHPGVNFPPDNGLDEQLSTRTPPIRLLRDGSTLLGSVRVRRDVDGSGLIEIVQRDPMQAGRGVGPVLMSEALSLLEEAGCRPIRLNASVENRRALALYERFGFAVVAVEPVYGVATRA